MRQRRVLSRSMDRGAKLWLIKYCKQQHWRVAHWVDLDDLIQDGYLHYQRILEKYPRVCEPAHLMSLFTRTFSNHLNDLSKQRSRLAEAQEDPPEIEDSAGWGEVCRVICEAPPEVRRALELLYLKPGKYHNASKRLGRNLMRQVREYLRQKQYVGHASS